MPATAQMNFRIEEDLKSRGDAALAAAGYTGSRAVRALWGFAARHANEPSVIARTLQFDDVTQALAEQQRRSRAREAVERGASICDEGRQQLGLTTTKSRYSMMDIEELRELALIDRAQERGWL